VKLKIHKLAATVWPILKWSMRSQQSTV